jgi:hypothetical protein
MTPVVGIFKSAVNVDEIKAQLAPLGVSDSHINIVMPERPQELNDVPTVQGEQPGMVKAIGAVAGGALGLGLGGTAAASFAIPGIGPVIAAGLAAGALAGALGAKIAGKIEDSVFEGLPEDELFVYEDALRKGHTLVFVTAEDKTRVDAIRHALEHAGAESVDRAREMWWVGLRSVEKERYEESGRHFEGDEQSFRRGFEAALRRSNRGQSYEQCQVTLNRHYQGAEREEPFRRGYERGRAYLQNSQGKNYREKSAGN